ncbi:MAG: hypothetical protein Q9190_002545 [Brigantiaea leucoxantha]
MKPPLPSATPTWHNDTYPTIVPSRPELSAEGKTVIITGAGSGIGRETARAFATAGAKRLILLGRHKSTLEETRTSLDLADSASCSSYDVATTDEKKLKDVAAAVGAWDVMILAAGYLSSPASISESVLDDWLQSFDTNVRGTVTVITAFLASRNPTYASIIRLTTAACGFPAAMTPGLSAYTSSKLAQVKILEHLAAENPGLFVASLHPGIVETDMFRKSQTPADAVPMDTGQ